MTQQPNAVNTIAPLTNVSAAMEAMQQAIDRAYGLPGLVCLYGPSGLGKSFGAAYVANKTKSYYIEAKSLWTRKTYLVQILKDMGIIPEQTMPDMLEQVCEQLALSGRPLIIDEADYLIDKNGASLLMDIYEGSRAPILFIGEERLPSKLKRQAEKVHNRVLKWVEAQSADADDCRNLARLYCPGVLVDDELLDHINTTVVGCTRRVVVNLNNISNEARIHGWTAVDLTTWGEREIYTGEARRG